MWTGRHRQIHREPALVVARTCSCCRVDEFVRHCWSNSASPAIGDGEHEAPAMTMLFPNLTVKAVEKSKRFWTALGFRFNDDFISEDAACLVITKKASGR